MFTQEVIKYYAAKLLKRQTHEPASRDTFNSSAPEEEEKEKKKHSPLLLFYMYFYFLRKENLLSLAKH